MKYKHLGFKFLCLQVLAVIMLSSCAPTTRTSIQRARVPFSIKSALSVDQIARTLFNAEAASCLQGSVELRGAESQFQVYATSGAGFPTDGSSYLVMSSGDATVVVPSTAVSFSSVNHGGDEGILPASEGGSPNGHSTFDRAALRVTLFVPSDATTLSFDWKFGSEEPPTFFKSNFQDYFTAVLEGTVAEGTWVDDNISDGANLPGGTSPTPTSPFPTPNNTIYNSTTPNIRTPLFDVTPFQGETVVLDFHVADATDFHHDSGVFLDNLRFDTPCHDFEYAAKLVCGVQKDPQDVRLARGFYATTINVHNPNDVDVTFFKKLALTHPPGGQVAGKIHPISTDVLGRDEALQIDCLDLSKRLFPAGLPAPYIKGFLVLQSPVSLDVTAVYTAAALDKAGQVTAHSSMDVEQIRERKIAEKIREAMGLDHFKVYEVQRIDLAGVVDDVNVALKGQFDDEPKQSQVRALTHFATPVRKNDEELVDKNAHLTWYVLEQDGVESLPTLEVANQFGATQILKLGRAAFLLAPVQKIEAGSAFPEGLDHYKCYTVVEFEPPINTTVTLQDQFGGPDEVRVTNPKFFCVPVEKQHGDQVTKIQNEQVHLTVYEITSEPASGGPQVTDQFFQDSIALGMIQSVYLAVPSSKKLLD